MSRNGHIRLFFIATLVWVGFWIVGLPAYYQQYSNTQMVWFDALVLIPIAAIVTAVLRPIRPSRRLAVSLWIAFYFTVPLAFYDWLYCGVYGGSGLRFILKYWYLSVYYVIPWILLPLVALALNRMSMDAP